MDKVAWLCDFSILRRYLILEKTQIGKRIESQEKDGFSLE